jgi:hypothetical protein
MTSSFGDELEERLGGKERLTVGELTDVMDQRTFAVVLLVLMFPSAMPIPTGGLTHVLEIASLFVALQMIAGREELWFPRRIRDHELGARFRERGIPTIARRLRWFERFGRARLGILVESRIGTRLVGVAVLVFVLGALVAPPFSGLDTLPSLGVVVIAIGLLLSDGVFVLVGTLLGSVGIVLVIVLGRAALELL